MADEGQSIIYIISYNVIYITQELADSAFLSQAIPFWDSQMQKYTPWEHQMRFLVYNEKKS